MVRRELMASPDAAWLRMDKPTNHMVVNSILWFDRPLDWDVAVAVLEERVVRVFPRFRQRVVRPTVTEGLLGTPRWEEVADLDLERQLHRVRLPVPGDLEALHDYAGRQASRPLAMDRPLWEAHLIDGFGDGCAVLLRTHHAMADGTALVQVLLHLADPPPGDEHDAKLPLADLRQPERHLGDRVAGAASTAAARLGRAARGYWAAWADPQETRDRVAAAWESAARLRDLPPVMEEERNALCGPLGADKTLTWSRPVPLEVLRSIGRATGGTVNDVAMALLAGALRRYLDERGDPRPRRLSAGIPVNLRPVDRPLARELGNRFGVVHVALPVDTDGPEERLASVRRQMDRIKGSREGVFVYGALGAMGQSPLQVQRAWIEWSRAGPAPSSPTSRVRAGRSPSRACRCGASCCGCRPPGRSGSG